VDDDQSGVDSGDVGVIRGEDSVASLGRGQSHVHVGNVRGGRRRRWARSPTRNPWHAT